MHFIPNIIAIITAIGILMSLLLLLLEANPKRPGLVTA